MILAYNFIMMLREYMEKNFCRKFQLLTHRFATTLDIHFIQKGWKLQGLAFSLLSLRD